MQAVLLQDNQLTLTGDYPLPKPTGTETLVRLVKAGICETDLQLVQGYMGFAGVLGHEFVGVAESGEMAGQRVVGEINCPCGVCSFCKAQAGNHCPSRTVLGILGRDGAFADYLLLPQANLYRVPDEIDTDEAVFVEPLAAAFRILEQVSFQGNERVVVLGDGRLGNLCSQVLRPVCAQLLTVGKHAEKLALMADLGIETALLQETTPDRSADVVVDCTGSASGIETALQWVRPLGTIVLKTTIAGTQTLSLAPVVIDEVTVVGSRCGPFSRALTALQNREIAVKPLISQTFPLSTADEAFKTARQNSVLKVLLEP